MTEKRVFAFINDTNSVSPNNCKQSLHQCRSIPIPSKQSMHTVCLTHYLLKEDEYRKYLHIRTYQRLFFMNNAPCK